jgi:hypothetical protein
MVTAVPVMVRSTIDAALRCRTAAGPRFSAPRPPAILSIPKSRLSSSFGKGVTEQTFYPCLCGRFSGENRRCCH